MAIKGRMTIKKSGGKRVRLWELESRPGSIIERLERSYLESLDAVDAMETAQASLAEDKRFTEDGAKEEFRNHVIRNAVPIFHKGRRALQQAQQQLADMRAKLQPPKPDPADAATAIAKLEIRTWLRSLPQAERDKITGASNLDPQIRAAIVEAPAQMTGVAESHRALILESMLRETHGDLIDEADELAAAIEAAESAVEGARETARLNLGIFDPAEFNELAAPIEAKQSIPWLRRPSDGADPQVVDLERGVMRPASPEELAEGIEAETLDEFNKRKAA